MDFGQQRLQQQNAARQMMYQNSGYQFERRDKKTLIVDVADNETTNPLSTAGVFSVDLFEPLIVDKLSDVYLDSFMTHNSIICQTGNTMAFALKINQFNINSNVASTSSNQHIFNSIIIPNDNASIDNVHSCVIHKGKKLNYVCSINPCKLSKISGKITDLDGGSMYNVLEVPSNSINGGKLHSVSIASLTHEIPSGTPININGISVNKWFGTTAFYHNNGSTTLFFYLIKDDGSQDLNNSKAFEFYGKDNVQIGTDKLTIANTHRIGDFPRFIAEFVIVARE